MDDVTSLDRSEGNSTAALYRAAVGSINTAYFERVFTRFEDSDRSGPSWNWAAAFITLNWMVFRRLWGAALAYVGAVVALALLVLGIGRLVLSIPPDMQWTLLTTLGVLGTAIPGFYGNALFYAACRKRMVEALATHATVEEACVSLQTNVVTVQRMLAIAVANLMLVGLCFTVYLLLPDFGNMPLQTAKIESVRTVTVPAPVAIASVTAPDIQLQPEPQSQKQNEPVKSEEITLKVPIVQDTPAITGSIASSKQYFVNAGLFADQNNALNAHSRLIDAGLPAVKSPVTGPRGKFTRVRVGPYETLAEAHSVADKIRTLKLDAAVVALP